MDSPFDRTTLDFYERVSPTYHGSGPGGVSRYLGEFLKTLPPSARVLELGCGGGRDSEAMLAAGIDVKPTEGSASIAHQAEARLGIPVRVMRFDELSAVESYDGVWASASLIHVPRLHLSSTLSKVHRALKSGGIHMATFKSGGAEGRDSAGRYYNYPSTEEITRYYKLAADWVLLQITPYIGGGFETGSGPWAKVEARKA